MKLINVVIHVVSLCLAVEAHACKRTWRNSNRDTTSGNDGNRSRPSLSAMVLGETGCKLTCNILSKFYGSKVRPVTRKMVFCDCNETFSVNGQQIDIEKFRTLPLNTLWDYWFERSPESSNFLNRVQRNGRVRAFLLPLLRNPHLTGNEIKQLIVDKFPQLNQIEGIPTVVHGDREDAVKMAAEVDYSNLDRIFPNLFNKAKSQVLGTPSETRLYSLFDRLSKDDLEYVKNQIQRTGNDSLIQIVTDYINNKTDDNDARQPRRGGRLARRLSKNSNDENRANAEEENGFDILERELIEIKVVNDLIDAVGGMQRVQPNESTPNAASRPLNAPTKVVGNMPLRNPDFRGAPSYGGGNLFANNLGDTIRKNIQNNIEQMKKQAEQQPDENGAHTTFDFNSVSDKVVTTNVNGKQTRVEDAGVKNIHKDSDRPEDNTDKEFELNAVSLKNKAQNLDNRVMQTVDTDNIKGNSRIQERVKNGDKEFVVFHDAGEKASTRGQPLNVANADALNDLKKSTYYLVIDEDGNIVHATNSVENDMSTMFQ